MSDLQTLVAQEVAKQLAAIAADQTTKKVLEFLKNRNSADAYVVEAWRSGTEWYRVWSDGFIEQGGYEIASQSRQTITFHKVMSGTDYTVTFGAVSKEPNYFAVGALVDSKGTTNMQTHTWNVNEPQPHPFYWEVKGL